MVMTLLAIENIQKKNNNNKEGRCKSVKRINFNKNWLIERNGTLESITLPHDAMLLEKRTANCKNGNTTGFFPGGTYVYRKRFYVTESDMQQVTYLEFEGIYMNAMVYVNQAYVGKCHYGYTGFSLDITSFLKKEENEVLVKVINNAEQNSRWYTGSGIYRDVYLVIGGLIRISSDSLRIHMTDIETDLAVAEISVDIASDCLETVCGEIEITIKDNQNQVVSMQKNVLTLSGREKQKVSQKIYIKAPHLWSVDEPYLYTCHVAVSENGKLLDETEETFGIRKIQLDPIHGLRINGKVTELRGACIHHDNGVIGACEYETAAERRIRILKQAGFNAIRSAHHPISKALLRACDQQGMLVMEESFNCWNHSKNDNDYALYFTEHWEDDIEAMVKKDYNHPSVIFYCIGNEIQELGSSMGNYWNRRIAEKVRSLDSTRYITNSINGLMCVMDSLAEVISAYVPEDALPKDAEGKPSGDINDLMTLLFGRENLLASHPLVTKRIEEACSALDVVGYNYGNSRYEKDQKEYPQRITFGSETCPMDIHENWKYVKNIPQCIGDFTWTGWDYIGEAGVGVVSYDGSGGFYSPYPCYLAYVGDIDITGHRRPMSYYREIVWGLRKKPYLAVQCPEHYGKQPAMSPWANIEAVASWTWPEFEGKMVRLAIYAMAEEVEIFLNQESCGKVEVGEKNAYKATMDLRYEPGELVAIAYENGQEVGRTTLVSADNTKKIVAYIEKQVLSTEKNELAYINVEVQDEQGVLHTDFTEKIELKIEGPGEILGFGSANPLSEENFDDKSRIPYYGKALVVVRAADQQGEIKVSLSANGCKEEQVFIQIIE